MLVDAADQKFLVYPSWLKIRPIWSELIEMHKKALTGNQGEPTTDFIPGAFGGGIIRVHSGFRLGKESSKWSVFSSLHSVCAFTAPEAMAKNRLQYRAIFCEPMDEPGIEYGLGKRAVSYIPILTPEHLSEGSGRYWVFESKSSSRVFEEEVGRAAAGFGLSVEAISALPDIISSQTSDWFKNTQYTRTWFALSGGENVFGYQWAVTIYVGLHMEKQLGRSLRCVHLLDNIEGEPRFRCNWSSR